MAKIVTIEIDENGNQTVDLNGYQGKGCDAVAQAFANAVGQAVDVRKKPEYNKPLVNKQKLVR